MSLPHRPFECCQNRVHLDAGAASVYALHLVCSLLFAFKGQECKDKRDSLLEFLDSSNVTTFKSAENGDYSLEPIKDLTRIPVKTKTISPTLLMSEEVRTLGVEHSHNPSRIQSSLDGPHHRQRILSNL